MQDGWKGLKGDAERPVKEAQDLDQLDMNLRCRRENEEERMNMRDLNCRLWDSQGMGEERMESNTTLETESWQVVHGRNHLIPFPWVLLLLPLSTSLTCLVFLPTNIFEPMEGISYSP